MSDSKYPPIPRGSVVKTTQPNLALRKEWTDEGWEKRKWNVRGRVVTHHDSHGLCYDVRHDDGTEGCYDPSELEVVFLWRRTMKSDKFYIYAPKKCGRRKGQMLLGSSGTGELSVQDLLDFLNERGIDPSRVPLSPIFVTYTKP